MRVEIPAGRGLRFALLLVAWIALFHVLPLFLIYSTSPGLKEAVKSGSVADYLDPPTCAQSASALGQDPAACREPTFAQSFERATAGLRAERNRIVGVFALTSGMLALAFLILVVGASLRGWWWFAIFFTPLALLVEGWALWRLSAFPARYWERR